MVEFENRYNTERYELIRRIETDDTVKNDPELVNAFKAKIAELEVKSREFIQEKLKEYETKKDVLHEEKLKIEADRSDGKSNLNQIYNRFKELHRKLKDLTAEVGKAKVAALHQLEEERKRKKDAGKEKGV